MTDLDETPEAAAKRIVDEAVTKAMPPGIWQIPAIAKYNAARRNAIIEECVDRIEVAFIKAEPIDQMSHIDMLNAYRDALRSIKSPDHKEQHP
jgi:hypothetical protein